MTIPREDIDAFDDWGLRAFTTTRGAGTFSFSSDEPARAVSARWSALYEELAVSAPRLAASQQVHGARIVSHSGEWEGRLRVPATDGHATFQRGIAMAVSVADCVPVFVAHPSGAAALLHSGWRGTVAGITERAVELFRARGLSAGELRIYLGPSICGDCYEVSADVFAQLTGRSIDAPAPVDLRAIIADRARSLGVREILVADACTRCDNDRFFSHRAGDPERQIGVLVVPRLMLA